MADKADSREIEYSKIAGKGHLKALGQFFTPEAIARLACSWTCRNARSMLDPAVGNGIFLREIARQYPRCRCKGYEIDGHILEFFQPPEGTDIVQGDYLAMDWEQKYDAIVCNPPYNRFQAVGNRGRILESIYEHTGVRYAGNSNLYVLFLLKSLYQLGDHGRLAYIVPTEFLNSAYGEPVKQRLLEERLLRAVISFDQALDVFEGANTTCCIILADREAKDEIGFYYLNSMAELEKLELEKRTGQAVWIKYDCIQPQEKWRKYLHQEENAAYHGLVPVDKYCRISRGIATGANDFFCLARHEAEQLELPTEYLRPCICSGRDIGKSVFRQEDFQQLAAAGKRIYLLTVENEINEALEKYIHEGEQQDLPQRYLLSRRQPWYRMEAQKPAGILISSAYRGRIKVVRNLAGVQYLTAFHGVYAREGYEELEDIIFCYFLTATGQELLRHNRKELGRGLEKFQPRDIQQGKMLDVERLSDQHRKQILDCYQQLVAGRAEEQQLCERLDRIFRLYLADE